MLLFKVQEVAPLCFDQRQICQPQTFFVREMHPHRLAAMPLCVIFRISALDLYIPDQLMLAQQVGCKASG